MASQLGWGMMAGSIGKRPAFVRYHERFQSRSAVQQARALDDALMPAASSGGVKQRVRPEHP